MELQSINKDINCSVCVCVCICVCLYVILVQLSAKQIKLDNTASVLQSAGYLPCDNTSFMYEHMDLVNGQ